MSLKKAFGTSKIKEKSGIWVTIVVNDDGTVCRFKLARMGQRNKEFMAKVAKVGKTLKGVDEASEMALVETVKAAFGTILLDWEHVKDYRQSDPTKEMEFTLENVLFLLTDLPDLADLVTREAMNPDNFKDDTEAQLKNSLPSTNSN